jgi:hypothetical protein
MSDSNDAVRILIEFGLDEKAAWVAADRLKDLGKQTEKAGEHAEKFNVHSRETHELLGKIDRLAPGLGESLRAMFAGPIGPLLLLGVAVGEVQKAFADYNKELDAIPAEQIKEHAAEIGRVREAWDAAQQAAGKYNAALATAGDEKDPIAKALANIKAVEEAQIESSKKIIEALGKQEVAYLRAHGASPDQIAAAEQRKASGTGRKRRPKRQRGRKQHRVGARRTGRGCANCRANWRRPEPSKAPATKAEPSRT